MNIKAFAEKTPIQRALLAGMMLLILLVPFDEGGNNYIGQGLAQALLLACSLAWAIHVLRQGKVTLITDRIDAVVFAAMLWGLVSLSRSEYKYATILELIKIAACVAVFYLMRPLFPLQRARGLLLFTLLASAALQAAFGWWLLNAQPTGLSWVDQWRLAHRTALLQADLVNANLFACALMFGVNIALAFLLFGSQARSFFSRQAAKERLLAFALLAFLLFTLFAKHISRGALVSLVVTGLFLAAFRSKRLVVGFLLLCGLLVALPLPGGSLLQKFQKRGDPYAYERIDIWTSSAKLMRDHPVFGVGLGMFDYYIKPYNFPVEHGVARYGKNINGAHNDMLQVGAETGGIGLLIFLAGLAVLARHGLRQLRFGMRDWESMAALAGMLGLVAQAQFSNLLISPAIAIFTTILAAIIVDGADRYRQKTLEFRASWRWYLLLGLIESYILIWIIGYPLFGHVEYLRYNEALRRKDRAVALRHLDAAIGLIPIHANYHYSLAMFSFELFERTHDPLIFEQAEKAFYEAIQANPVNYIFYESLAMLYKEQFYQTAPQPKRAALNALRAYQLARRRNPFNPFIAFSAALIYADVKDYPRALQLLQTAVAIEPNFVGAHQMLGKLYAFLGQAAESEAAFRRAEGILAQYKTYKPESHYIYTLLRPLESNVPPRRN